MALPYAYTPNFRVPLPRFDTATWHDMYYQAQYTWDALLRQYTGVIGIAGTWQNSTQYLSGVRVVDSADGTIWTSSVDHVSASAPTTFVQDRTANPTYWLPYTFTIQYRGLWQSGVVYSVGDYVSSGHVYAYCTTPHTSGTSLAADTAYWEELIDATPTVDACIAQANAAAASAAAAEASAQSVGARLIGTSASSLTIGLGAKTLTTQPAEGWCPGIYITVSRASALTQYMSGIVTAYDANTGVLSFIADATSGSGTDTSWNIALGGRGGTGGGGMAISNTATHTQVAAAPSTTTILASNPNRTGGSIYNDSSSDMQVKLGPAVSLTDFTLRIIGGGYFEIPFGWTGIITGMWTTAIGSAHVVEFTP